MSKMDSILDLKDVFKAAERKGLHAFAVTDHGVVQGYPFISKYSKDYPVSGIFGLEGYMINSEEPSVQLSHKIPCNAKFSEEEFVVFDLETTGLTGITERMHEGNPGEKDNFVKFREFVGNGILVAHNSDFDVNFINYRMKKYKLDKFYNTVI